MRLKRIIVVCGLIISLFLLLIPPPAGLTVSGKNAFAIFIISLTLWVTNIIPLAMTSLLGMALIPLLGVMDVEESFSLFGNKAIFFILGALILAAGIQKTGLGVRIAYRILLFFDGSANNLIGGILTTAALLSCIMPEHAVAALLFPIVIQISRSLNLKPMESQLGKALFLSLAWGAVIGGITTYLGGARNLLAVDILQKNYHISIGFVNWILMALPIPIIILILAYFTITYFFKPEITDSVEAKKKLEKIMGNQGQLSKSEKKLIAVLIMVILMWLLLSSRVDIAITALLGGVAIFVLDIVKWKDIVDYVNWGVIFMYGGAIVVASSLSITGAAAWLSSTIFSSISVSPFIFIAVITLVTKLLTEGISNVAAVAIILPLAFSWGEISQINPIATTLAVALSGGLAFCLPMGTPPNAIAFSAGYYRISDVLKVGVILNIISWVVVLLISKFYWPLLGINL
ncbi:SLC13 family permease [Halothermothrix orenii]|uniref:Sodium-dependent dicarboxylate transporter SdcS n=1 Tax=Halothermothrix orenii (strain H 168 / OCM 544 / DSM 9562) TaxID=373903 RepID=B8D0P1_HALOH|nr:DASS family sodium-coupled anion symporter [Halothermothrix orenii]ACL70977.1 anion transporter [Halothermothrix orenii H 168]